jgi:peptidoglycan/xylan/chitin deacetylase (PgdA/CDA1 family)
MRKFLRRVALTSLKGVGVFTALKNSSWRRQRLLILCYHGISLEDEHEWRPALFVSPQHFERRLSILEKEKYTVLPLGEAVERLYRNDLPPRSVAITFDDGTYDFYRLAYPRLKQYGFPSTVYLTTYYSNYERPVFNLICPYMVWKARGNGIVDLSAIGAGTSVALASTEAREKAAAEILHWVNRENMSGSQKDEVAAMLAKKLRIDYEALCAKRILQVMNRQEVKELADAGVDIQMHTHRHRTPVDEELFRREIRDNRDWLAGAIGRVGRHFCYPSGVYRAEFLPWLTAEKVVSATTCDTGLATARDNPLLLPRLVDTTGRSDLEFEGWLNGASYFISRRRRGGLAAAD